VVFYTKPNVSPNGPLAPRVTINITLSSHARMTRHSAYRRRDRCSA
jgi:hypothetical protein